AGLGGTIDLAAEFGFPEERAASLDRTSELAIGAGLDALRDAGIPLVMRYKDTTTGTKLRERWMLPESYQDSTGVIFASAFPGSGAWVEEADRYYSARSTEERLAELKTLAERIEAAGATPSIADDLHRRIAELETEVSDNGYTFDRKFLYRALSFAHAQFAEYIGAKGPNTQINAACASTTQAVAIAEDWIRAGRCERVVIISGDDVTSDELLEWIGAGFLTMGAAATDERVEDAATPFDRRRHGLILGMGAAAIVVEHPESVRERGIEPIAEVLATHTANSAFHGSRLDPSHICHAMESVVADAERRWGIDRLEIAAQTVFVSHETYTPARGGSAQAEIDALRFVFGDAADQIVISNTKGYTGHAMGVGVEDVLAIKAMETGVVPPVPNYREPDPDLGDLNLAQGGTHSIQYALRLGAGFGSQVSLTLYRDIRPLGAARPMPGALGYETRLADATRWNAWLASASGVAEPEIEISKRTLRIADNGSAPSTAPAPVTATAVVAAAPAAAAPAGDAVADRVLALVSEQTGYPPDMLDLDLDLEADLGVDTVKQAETFA
ncbi:MAG: beta-ketoacyl synthase, partial [bacterium]|nr:beta-ketoacyl synthase [bacterium]